MRQESVWFLHAPEIKLLIVSHTNTHRPTSSTLEAALSDYNPPTLKAFIITDIVTVGVKCILSYHLHILITLPWKGKTLDISMNVGYVVFTFDGQDYHVNMRVQPCVCVCVCMLWW